MDRPAITHKTKTRISFDYDGKRRETYEMLAQIICSSHWGSGIDIFGLVNESHRLLFDFVLQGVIVIDEYEYELKEPYVKSENAWLLKSLLGKRSHHTVLDEMAELFADEPFETAKHYRNTIYFPNLKAFARADGMKPEDIAEMLSRDDCEKIILFPYFPLDGKTAYYELTLAAPKAEFVKFLNHVAERQQDEMNEAIIQANERSKAGYRATLRLEKKSDWKVVEQITYRAFRDAPPTADDDGMEALLARKLRSRPAFVPELDYVAELDDEVIGNIMYTRSKVIGSDGEWETLTFGPVSVLPKYQKQGVGSALIRKTLTVARELGYRAVLIFGYESYYPRFGFQPASEFGITTVDGKNFPAFMALPLYDGALGGVHGKLVCDEAYTTLDREESDKLNAKLSEPMDVDEYINAQSLYVQQFLRQIRRAIWNAAPDAIERIANKKPSFWQGQDLIRFVAYKRHVAIYPGAEAMAHFSPKLWKYKRVKGAIQFPYADFGDVQLALIEDIAAWCAASVDVH